MKRLLLSTLLIVLTASFAETSRADAIVVFNEVMYHPPNVSSIDEANHEWLELRNQLAVDVDISDWSISGGIQFTFASNTIVKGGGHLLLALSPDTLKAQINSTNVLGPFAGRLSNNGDTIRLRNNSGRVMDELNYGADGDWPVGPDGSGVSLAKRDPDSASGPAANWTVSEQMGGSPGTRNFATGLSAPAGAISYWSFSESIGASSSDSFGPNSGTNGPGVTRVTRTLGRALSFDGTSNAFVNVGGGGSFNVGSGLTIEAVLWPGWSGTNTAVIFRKAPRRPPGYRDAVLTNNPIAYWRLGDASTSITDATVNARTGAATAGVLLNQPSLIPSDPANTAMRFTGAERVTVNGFEKIGTAGYTVEFWVRPHVLPTGCCQNLVGDGESAGDYFMMTYILGPGQGLAGAIRPHFGPANLPSLTGTTALQANNTYHIVATWDTGPAANNAIIYINGQVSTVGTTGRIVPALGTTGNNRVYLGKDDRDTTDGTETLDEVALYNRPLTAAEVAAHYLAATAVNFDTNQGNAIQLAFQNDGNHAAANPPVAAGPVLSFGLTVGGVYSELDMPLDGASGRPTLASLEDGQPHHVAATFDGATGLKAISIDGVRRFSTTLSGGLNGTNFGTAILGNAEISGGAPFVGTLDEMAYWGRALSTQEVATHWSNVQMGRGYFAADLTGDSAHLTFNEVSASTNADFWLELNYSGSSNIALLGYVIVRAGATNLHNEYVFPCCPVLSAGGSLAVSNSTLGFHPVDGDRLFLLTPNRDRVVDALVVTRGPRARSPDGTGPWLRPSAPSPGGANAFAFHSEIVINEIMYAHKLLPSTNNLPPQPSRENWIELYNNGASPVDLTGWELDGGIQYRFSIGQTIPVGGYLVVADDAATLRAIYPAITIVGNYSGRLSGRSDRIVLRDPAGNPADTVRYFGDGRWPGYANGGGSSLELRDPNADNAKAEAWAASDESAGAAWQNYSYRMTASIPSGSGQPTVWNDFILGLQEAGECLIDDVSVIQAPASTALPCITNGGFENGVTGWRMLGDHNRSRVEVDPDNAANHVLHVFATGPQEHMHNHIEATFVPGRTIANTEYQISFRARWLAGSSLLNTRLYFNRASRTSMLPAPIRNGTPGARNSRWLPNVGPTFSGFGHSPVVPQPGTPVTVSVTAQDPQGVDSAQVWWSVNSGAWNNAPMTQQGGGLYSGTIPAANAGNFVQFYVRAVDALGAAATFPARGPESGALYTVNDNQAILSLANNVRVIVTSSNIDYLHGTAQGVNQTNVMSNDLVPCTIVYNESRAYYDCGVHLRGSQRGRYSDVRTGFHIEFQPDDLFRGVHPVMLVDRSGAGDATANRQEEIILKHMLNRAGDLPGTYGEIARVIAPRAAHTGPCQFFPRHEDLFLETAFENGGDGTQFEMELIYYPTSANAAGYKLPQPDSVIGTDLTDLGNDKEIYRYNFMIKNHRDMDDYSRFIQFCKALTLSGPALDAASKQVMDIDQWMRAYAMASLGSVGDMYSFGNNHNFFTYQRATDGKFIYMPWDMDFTFTRGSGGALVGDQNIAKVVNLPGNLRRMYAHMLDIIGRCFNTSYMTYWTAHYASLAPGQSYAGHLSTIGARATFVTSQINSGGGNSNFIVNGSATINTSNNLVTLTGTAPVTAYSIRVNGREYAVTWTSVSTWTIRVPVSEATSVLNLVGHDLHGNALTNFARTVTVNYTGPVVAPETALVINEIMYNPVTPDASFVEIFNNSSFAFDLSGWRVNGLDYTFPSGAVINNGQFLVLAGNSAVFAATYGTNVIAFGEFSGQLDDGGEAISLERPLLIVSTNGSGLFITNTTYFVVDRVKYDDDLPWFATPDGFGPSLQLIDHRQDNARVSNWGDGSGWRQITYTGTLQGSPAVSSQDTNFLIFLNTAGDVYIDDLVLVLGTVAGTGTNLITNGDFESAFSGPWAILGNHASSAVSTSIRHSGGASLHVVASGNGNPNSAAIRQSIPGFTNGMVATLSYWILPSTNGNQLTVRSRPSSTMNSIVSILPVSFTPGAANSGSGSLPAYDSLWINELQPDNLAGPSDNFGEREPWVEIHNAGLTSLDLSGYFLADNYASNLTQWPFPPGASIAPGEFKIVWTDGEPGETSGTNLHTSFRLNSATGSVALVRMAGGSPQITDYLTYSALPAGRSYGDYPNGQPFTREEFYRPTPGGPNDNTAAPLVVFINEWMAANTQSLLNTNNNNKFDDWFELYNPGNSPADLAGYYLTDNLSNKFQFLIPPGFVIPPHGFKLVWADGADGLNNTNHPDLHVSFKLTQDGEQIGLFASDGTLIDAVTFEPQFNDITQGRYPDGPTTNYFLAGATPRASNTSWANRYPVLSVIPDATVYPGVPFTFNAAAADPDSPPQILAFALEDGAPAGAGIDPLAGAFAWTPTAQQTPGTNVLTVRVTDNGVPALGAARSFTVIVRVPLLLGGVMSAANGDFSFTVGTIVGKTYRVEFKDHLNAATWTPLGPDQVAASTSLAITDNIGTHPQRFYRVVLVN